MWRKFISGFLISLIALGITCRFVGLNWDSNFHLHPDERFLTMTAVSLQWPQSWSAYFHTNIAPLNPFNHQTDFFVYGQLPLLLTKAVAAVFQRDNYNDLVLVGRFLSAFFDSLTVLFTFLIAREINGSRLLGLLAAAFLSLTALHIQHSHFFVVDTFAVTFLAAAFYFAIIDSKLNVRRSTFDVLSGVCFGAAVACKFSSVLFAINLIALLLLRAQKGKACLAPTVVALCAAFISFRVFHPVAFQGEGGVLTLWGLLDVRPHPQFWNALAYQQEITSGEIDVPFNLQWIDRADFLYPLWNLGSWALGWPLLVSSICGLFLLSMRVLKREKVSPALCIAAVWVLVVLLFYGAQYSKFTRYYLVMTPFLALVAAWFLLEIKSLLWRRVAIAGVLLSTLVWALAITSIYTREHPRVAATNWILANIPASTPIANESAWDDSLPLRSIENYRTFDLKLFEADDENKRRHLIEVLDRVEWIFISSPRVRETVPRAPQRYPMTTEYYRALFDGRLGFELAHEWKSYPQFLGFNFPDDNVEEALTVYDHPRVMLFRKTPKYSRKNTEACSPLPHGRGAGVRAISQADKWAAANVCTGIVSSRSCTGRACRL